MIRGTYGPAWVPGFIGDSTPAEGNQGPNDPSFCPALTPNVPAEANGGGGGGRGEKGGGKVVQGVWRDTWTSAPQKSTSIFHGASGARRGGTV